jgi:hypothetical protein
MTDFGDALLFTVSARRTMTWSGFRDSFDSLYSSGANAAAGSVPLERWRAARLLDGLGHCDFSPAAPAITVAPAVLAALPVPGLPVTVVCGSRAPATVTAVRCAAAKFGAEVNAAAQRASDSLAPARIQVQAERFSDLMALGDEIGLQTILTPPAWLLAEAMCSMDQYLSSLDWSTSQEINWHRQDFDPRRLVFGERSEETTSMRLSSYEDPIRRTHRDMLWLDEKCAEVDRTWGRYALLHAAGVRVLSYERTSGTVAVPQSVPLPRLAARAFVLCSGRSPIPGGIADVAPAGEAHDLYSAVPADVFAEVAIKLGQA